MSRGYAVIALDQPKFGGNVGATMRAAWCYGAELVVIAGQRFRHEPTDTPQAWRHIPTLEVADVFDALPFECVPVAVDLLPDATPLPRFVHPERAFYIFGGEDRTLSHEITARCPHKVYVPTRLCMNLAATVNVVLYDRMVKTAKTALPISAEAAPVQSMAPVFGMLRRAGE